MCLGFGIMCLGFGTERLEYFQVPQLHSHDCDGRSSAVFPASSAIFPAELSVEGSAGGGPRERAAATCCSSCGTLRYPSATPAVQWRAGGKGLEGVGRGFVTSVTIGRRTHPGPQVQHVAIPLRNPCSTVESGGKGLEGVGGGFVTSVTIGRRTPSWAAGARRTCPCQGGGACPPDGGGACPP